MSGSASGRPSANAAALARTLGACGSISPAPCRAAPQRRFRLPSLDLRSDSPPPASTLAAMRGLAPRSLAVAAALAASLVLAAPALGAPAVNGIFKLGSEIGTNNKIVTGPDGNVWFTLESATK